MAPTSTSMWPASANRTRELDGDGGADLEGHEDDEQRQSDRQGPPVGLHRGMPRMGMVVRPSPSWAVT